MSSLLLDEFRAADFVSGAVDMKSRGVEISQRYRFGRGADVEINFVFRFAVGRHARFESYVILFDKMNLKEGNRLCQIHFSTKIYWTLNGTK